jgi:ATP-dependent Lon protease
VLPVGGIKEKVLDTGRAGIGTMLLPQRNRTDLDDVPASVHDMVRFVWLEWVDDAIAVALEPQEASPGRAPRVAEAA